jgi:hypothetical protein
MYTPSHNIENPDQEIVCVMTGESYVYLEGDNKTIMDPKLKEGAIDSLPGRFFTQPWVIRTSEGQIRVFGRLE